MKNFGLFSLLLLLALGSFAGGKGTKPAEKVSRPGVYQGYSVPEYRNYTYQSYYVPMQDSTLLAVDVFLPKGLEKGKKIPAIFYPTRYNRSIQAKFPINLFIDPILVIVDQKEVEFFTSHGYACIIADARGSGASMGTRNMEFSPQEIADNNEVVNWIVKQDWCTGKIGTSGISYGATAAELLLANQNPAVKACVPRSGIFDLYSYVLYPGGICQGPFVDVWGFTTRSLDNNNYEVFGGKAKFVTGIHPVQADRKKVILREAMNTHKKNFDVFAGLRTIKFRDDHNTYLNAAADDFSVHSYREKIENSGTAIYRIGGWYDGALAKSCTDGFLSTKNTEKVLIGPWDHGPHDNASPYAKSKENGFDFYTEILRFFDYHLKGIQNGINDEPAFSYFTVGQETWQGTDVWPPQNVHNQKLFLSADKSIVNAAGALQAGALNYKVDYTATTDSNSRWNSVTALYKHGPTNYNDRRKENEKLLCFTSAALTDSMEITGHPVVNLRFAADANDATVFCYLEDVAPDGKVTYVTEGLLRPAYRKVTDDAAYRSAYPDHSYKKEDDLGYTKNEVVDMTIDLLPISYRFEKGHQIRVSVAGADAGHFDFPAHKPDNFTVTCAAENGSWLELPVVGK